VVRDPFLITNHAPRINMYHLAQLNIGRLLQPVDHPQIADFVAQLDEINALADEASGFVWRLVGEGNNAMDLRPYANDNTIATNMSVWESVEALFDYTYQSEHVRVMRDRKKWFAPYGKPFMVLWWIPAGHIPTLAEAVERLEHLQENGATPFAFSFKQRFPTP
jgi:hypothetical protein